MDFHVRFVVVQRCTANLKKSYKYLSTANKKKNSNMEPYIKTEFFRLEVRTDGEIRNINYQQLTKRFYCV